jgi:hypothetical protein
MPEPAQQTNKADEGELGTVISYNGRYAFVRPDKGGPDVYLGTPELLKARIEYLSIGTRVCLEIRKATDNRRPWGARVRLAEFAGVKSSDPLEALRRENLRPPPKREADLVRYDYYASHPEHRPRRQTRRTLRRRLIREV